MTASLRTLALFAIALGALFGVGALAGGLLDPKAPGGEAEASHGSTQEMQDMTTTTTGHAGAGTDEHAAMKADAVRGLAVADNGLRLLVETPALRRGAREQLRFRLVDDRNRAVRDFDVQHTKRMHLIVARRDLSTFQHLHPTMAADGTWSTPLTLTEAGTYRVFADVSHDGEATTLASDLRVDGPADLKALPAPRPVARSADGYEVRLAGNGDARAGRETALRFAITKDGAPVHTEPYLGAGGHLVALRDGDLAFLHVHPLEHGHDDEAGDAGEDIGFEATFPTTGRYRLFLQFQVDGRVQTVAFTQEVR